MEYLTKYKRGYGLTKYSLYKGLTKIIVIKETNNYGKSFTWFENLFNKIDLLSNNIFVWFILSWFSECRFINWIS
jgi:hypothetical protein